MTFILPEVVICCTHQYLNSMFLVVPKASSGSCCFHRVESVRALATAFNPRSDNNDCTPNPSAAPVPTAWCRDFAVLNARVACIVDQCFATASLILIIPPLDDFLSGPFQIVNCIDSFAARRSKVVLAPWLPSRQQLCFQKPIDAEWKP